MGNDERTRTSAANKAALGKRLGYLPTLDGWRAVAIVSMVLFHDSIHRFGPLNTLWFQRCGERGVDLFFAISGILICSRLLEEERVHKAISLSGFYIRRFFRILPPAFLYLLTMAILGAFKIIAMPARDLIASLLFFRNYLPANPEDWYTAHFWSLSVEEHFYLVIPGLLVFVRHSRLKVLSGLVVAMTIWHVFIHYAAHPSLEKTHTDTRITFILIPAVFAIALQEVKIRERLTRWTKAWPIFLVSSVLVVTAAFWIKGLAEVLLVPVVMPVILSLLLLSTVLHPANPLSRFLELKPLRFIGHISYSLYLWQQLFFLGHFGNATSRSVISELPLGVRALAMFVCAYASYRLLERPMIKLGHKLAPPATPGRDDVEVAIVDSSPAQDSVPAAQGPSISPEAT